MRTKASAATIVQRFVVAELVKAEAALVAAHKATADELVAGELAKARRIVRGAMSRATAVLKHVSLTTAPQSGLFDPPQED